MKHVLLTVCVLILLCGAVEAQTRRRPARLYEATAFAQGGVTASGRMAHRGEVAADKRLLPLGTRIRVINAGPYSGIYTVADTGPAIQGRHIDIFMPDADQAKTFGKKTVRVRVLRWGPAPATMAGR